MTRIKKVTVIRGGIASEREVSLRSGAAVAKVLRERGYDVMEFDPADGDISALMAFGAEAAFIALHGAGGEDGSIQGLLEVLRIPYTGCGVMASAVCYDKILTKLALKPYKVLTPPSWVVHIKDDLAVFLRQTKIKFPVIVKPSREGSTIGITIVKKRADLPLAIREAAKFCDDILIEAFIRGRELTAGIIDGQSLPLIEVAPKSGFYDYKSKYTPGQTEYLLPAPIAASLARKISTISEKIYAWLGCCGAARLDYIVDKKGKPWFLEINTIPGMTATSLLPKAAAAAGMNFGDLCERILVGARLDVYPARSALPRAASTRGHHADSTLCRTGEKGFEAAGPHAAPEPVIVSGLSLIEGPQEMLKI